jgi:hypothetical protein
MSGCAEQGGPVRQDRRILIGCAISGILQIRCTDQQRYTDVLFIIAPLEFASP